MMGEGMKMPPATARARGRIEGGARLVFIPKDPADLPQASANNGPSSMPRRWVRGSALVMQGHGEPERTPRATTRRPKD
jgi:hypothetical protein